MIFEVLALLCGYVAHVGSCLTDVSMQPIGSILKKKTILNLMFIGPCIIVIVEEWKTNLMSLAILFHFLCTQHVSDINISIIRSLRLFWRITTSVVLFSVCCVLEIWYGWFWVVSVLQVEAFSLQHRPDRRLYNLRSEHSSILPALNFHPAATREPDGLCGNQRYRRELLVMCIMVPEACWA